MKAINECLDSLSPKNVLDLGVGTGKRSIRYLKKGARVLGVDKIERELPAGIDFQKLDIREFKFEEEYDLIIASLVLHYLKIEEAVEVVRKMKASTEVGGHNFVLMLNPDDGFAKGHSDRFHVFEKDLEELYSDWEIVKSGSFETPMEEHDGLAPHKHSVSFMLAKKL